MLESSWWYGHTEVKQDSEPKKKKKLGNLQSSSTKLNLSVWIFLLKHLFSNDSCAFKAMIFPPVLNISFHKLSPSITVELETSESENSRSINKYVDLSVLSVRLGMQGTREASRRCNARRRSVQLSWFFQFFILESSFANYCWEFRARKFPLFEHFVSLSVRFESKVDREAKQRITQRKLTQLNWFFHIFILGYLFVNSWS